MLELRRDRKGSAGASKRIYCISIFSSTEVYDSVDRELRWLVPAPYGLPANIIAITSELPGRKRVYVQRKVSECPDWFDVE